MMGKTHEMKHFNRVMMVVFLIFTTVQNVGVLKVFALWDEGAETAIVRRVSGEEESEKVEAFVLEKFRVLLGLKTLHKKTKSYRGSLENGAPAPSPLPEPAAPNLVPAPAPAIHLHKHHRPPRPRPMLPIHKFDHDQRKENGKQRVILIAVLLSAGLVLLIFALVVFFVTRMFNRRKKVDTRMTSVCSEEGGIGERSRSVIAQQLASKVIQDPSFDMLYLDSLTTAIEPESCLGGACDTSNPNTPIIKNIGCATQSMNQSEHEISQSDLKETCSLAEDVISVHEYAESCRNESDDQSSLNGDKIAATDPHSLDDESFHSLSDSRTSSNLRLSNVSVSSFTDPVEFYSPNQSNRLLSAPNNSVLNPTESTCNQTQPDTITDVPHDLQTIHDNSQPTTTISPPPPPLPPPPPSFARVSPVHFCSSSKPSVHASQSAKILHSSLPKYSSSSPASNPENSPCASPSSKNIPDGSTTIPTPPPGPPHLPNSGNTFKGPPPPPGQPPSFTPMGKNGNPLPKLKPLHWDKVRATPDHSMVWDQLRCSSFELDEETIESLFGYNLKTALKNEEGKSKTPSPSKHVLEPKRLQNITILSKALNVTAEKVCEALMQGDGLCSQQLEALVKMAPTKEEEAKLSSYRGEIDELGFAEKLVKEMVTIPCAFERVEAMLYKATFDDEVVHLRNSFSMLEEACKELRSSRLFLKLLEAVLKTGNRMNVGTIRGGARAFKLDALLKLADVKGTDGKTTLLHFVVQEMVRSEGIRMSDSIMGQIDRSGKRRTVEEKEDDYRRMGLELVTGLSTELCNVKRTASLDVDVLATSVSSLSDGMSQLQQLVSKDLCTSKDNFVHAMKSFLNHAEYNLKELQAEETKVLQSVRQITEYYHGDVSKEEVNPLRIFVVVRDFLGMLDQVCRELKALKTPRSPNPLAPFQ